MREIVQKILAAGLSFFRAQPFIALSLLMIISFLVIEQGTLLFQNIFSRTDRTQTVAITAPSPPKNTVSGTSVRKKTTSLKNTLTLYSLLPGFTKSLVTEKLEKSAKDRFTALESALETDPQAVLDAALPQKSRKKIPSGFSKYIEKDIVTNGRVSAYVVDNFDSGKDKVDYFLKTDNKTQYKVKIVDAGRGIPVESAIKGTGLLVGNTVLFSGIKGDLAQAYSVQLTSVPVASLQLAKEKKLAVVLLNFPNTLRTIKPISFYQGAVFTDSTSLSNFYKENSYLPSNTSTGLTVTGDVFDWITLPPPQAGDPPDLYTSCKIEQWTIKAEQLILAKVPDLTSKYTNVMYVIPDARKPLCNFDGLANMWNTSAVLNDDWFTAYAHEFGHNLGLGHAKTISCNGKPVDEYQNCTIAEYGDNSSVMAAPATPNQFNSPQKVLMQWLPNNKIFMPQAGVSQVSLESLEKNNGTYHVLKFQKADTNEEYFVSYRARIGHDSDLEDKYVGGASVHILPAAEQYQGHQFYTTKLLAFNAAGVPERNILFDGELFTDSKNNLFIKQISHTNTNVTLEVTVGAVIATSPTPTPTIVAATATQQPNVTFTPSPTQPPDPTPSVVVSTNTPTPQSGQTPTPIPTVNPNPNGTTMSMLPQSITLQAGESFPIVVNIANVANLQCAQFTVSFNPSQVEIVDQDPSTTGTQIGVGTILTDLIAFNTVDTSKSTIFYVACKLGQPNVSGSGTVATITVKGKNSGTSSLTFIDPGISSGTQMVDPDGYPIPFTAQTATLRVN